MNRTLPLLSTGLAALCAASWLGLGPQSQPGSGQSAHSQPVAATGRAPLQKPPLPQRVDARFESRLKVRRDENGNIPPNAMMNAKRQMDALRTEGTAGGLDSNRWTTLGPGNIGGRVRSVAIHPTQTNTILVGSVSGGVWRSTDAGRSWTAVNDLMSNLAISSIVFDPTDANVVYASTGEGRNNIHAVRGAGIFKSTNGGTTWTQLASTANANFYWVNRVSISSDGQSLLAACIGGLWRSTNGGQSFARVGFRSSPYLRYDDVRFHPQKPNVAVAHLYRIDFFSNQNVNEIAYSTNGGQTWSTGGGSSSFGPTRRTELAWHSGYSGAGNGVVYAQRDGGPNQTQLYRSVNGGQTFTRVSTSNILSSQGWYDNTLWVDPSDTDANVNNDIVVCGGIDLHRSNDGGRTFTKISDWSRAPVSAHADQHIIIEHPNFGRNGNKTVFFGNDGGLYRTDDVYAVAPLSGWVNLNNGLEITQFYGGSAHRGSGVVYGGTQDNGTLQTDPQRGMNWRTSFGGDGGFSASDPTDSQVHYGEYVNGRIHRTDDGGRSAEYIWGQHDEFVNGRWVTTYKNPPYIISDVRSQTNAPLFIAPFVMDPNVEERILLGGASLWRTNDAKAPLTKTTGPKWEAIKAPVGRAKISAIAVQRGDSDQIWVGYDNGEVYKTQNGTATAPTWMKLSGLPSRYVTRITLEWGGFNRVLVTFGGYASNNIWESRNGGSSWAALLGVPAVPVRDVAIHGKNLNWLYAGTEVGLLVSEDAGRSWTSSASKSTVTIDELFWRGGDLVVVTHGRGMFAQRAYNAAVATPKGPTCGPNPATRPVLSSPRPELGTSPSFRIANAPSSSPGVVLVGSPGAPLPIPGHPGCVLQASVLTPIIQARVTIDGAGNGQSPPLPLPNWPFLAGAKMMIQSAIVSNGGLYVSNGVELTFGY